jgi:hypothetical protein
MAKKEEEQESGNLLKLLMSQASDLDFSDPDSDASNKNQDPSRLLVEGFE